MIKAGSCNGGIFNCQHPGYYGTSIIGANSCNGGKYTCVITGWRSKSIIGDNSCNSKGPTFYTCGYTGQTSKIAIIGNHACNAEGACLRNKGTIADGCCNYKNACRDNKGEIKLGSKECGATAAPTPAPTPAPIVCNKTCIDHHWTSCGHKLQCPPGWRKIREDNGPCYFARKRYVCERRYPCKC